MKNLILAVLSTILYYSYKASKKTYLLCKRLHKIDIDSEYLDVIGTITVIIFVLGISIMVLYMGGYR